MELKDQKGNFIMADNPAFDPLYSYLEKNNIPLAAHLGEPKNCWLPLEEMTVTSDRDYFSRNPVYHMYLQPHAPSYKDQRSEEHTSELQSRGHLVCRLLLEKKKQQGHAATASQKRDKRGVGVGEHT